MRLIQHDVDSRGYRYLLTLAAFGAWWATKARDQAARHGTAHAARNLRKQGVPLPMAVSILARV